MRKVRAMKPSEAMRLHRDTIWQVVEANAARNPRVFGSALRGTDTDKSDLDILVDGTAQLTLLKLARISRLLESLLGVSVDVLTPEDLPKSFRETVLTEAVSI